MKKIQLFSLFGIPIMVDVSSAILVAYLFFVFSGGMMRGNAVYGMLSVVGVVLLFLLSILIHELAHSLTARCFGSRIRSITLHVFGGMAMLEHMPKKAWQSFLIAIVGPLSSFGLSFLFAFLANLSMILLSPVAREGAAYLTTVFLISSWVNILLAIFNCVPAYPLDGGRVFCSLLRCFRIPLVKATAISVYLGCTIAAIWIVLWVLDLFFAVSFDFNQVSSVWLRSILEIFFNVRGWLLPLIAYMVWVSGLRELAYVRYMEAYEHGDRI